MSARSFLDTNVLVYTDDHDTPDKQRVALDLVEQFRLQRTGVVSTQVLHAVFANENFGSAALRIMNTTAR